MLKHKSVHSVTRQSVQQSVAPTLIPDLVQPRRLMGPSLIGRWISCLRKVSCVLVGG